MAQINLQPVVDALNAKHEIVPESANFYDGEKAYGKWYELQEGRIIECEQVVGSSGVYLVETDYESGEALRDGRPWQMSVG